MKKQIHALQPMLDALKIEKVITLDQCMHMLTELRTVTGSAVPPFELSGNQWCALMNLAIARHGSAHIKAPAPQAEQGGDGPGKG